MAKLTKQQRKLHAQACDVLSKDVLTVDDKIFVLENWHEGATHMNGAAGAFFTPNGLARDFVIDAGGGRNVIDLCAGIGALSFWLNLVGRAHGRMVCVEANADYIAVGRKILPEAEWIQADVFDLPADIGTFDLAIANPPFGTISRSANAPRYSGRKFEYHVIDVASQIAERGAFIVPQQSAPFRYSGSRHYVETTNADLERFAAETGITLEPGCGIDTGFYLHDWHGVAPMCEVVTAEFDTARDARPAVSAMLAKVAASEQLLLL